MNAMDFGSTSTWDDWLVTRSATGDQFADGIARALHDPNALQHIDFGAAGTRDGLRKLFTEFEEATADQEIRGRSMVMKPRGPDAYQFQVDQEQGQVAIHYGSPGGAGFFVAMDAQSASNFLRGLLQAVQQLSDGQAGPSEP